MKIKFLTTGLNVSIPATENTKFHELVEKLFEVRNAKYEDGKGKVFYEIGLTGKTIEPDSNSTVKELNLKNNSIIYVTDNKGIIVSKSERKATRTKTNVVEEKGGKTVVESFPEILGDMALFSEECLSETTENKTEGENDFINCEEALTHKMDDKHIFLFGLIGKYLEDTLNANVFIDRDQKKDSFTREEKWKGLKTLRYLSNGFLTKTKSTVRLEANSTNEINDDKKREGINQKFKKNLMQEYTKLKDDNFVVKSIPDSGQLKFLLIQVKQNEVEIEQTKVQKSSKIGIFKNDDVEMEEDMPLIDSIILNKAFLLPKYDSNDDSKFGFNELRGKEKYYPPVGWWRFGVLAYDFYGNNNEWLDYKGKNWCVAYVGLRKPEIEEKVKEFENDEDVRHPGKKVGLGVAVCQNPKDMEEDCAEIENGNEVYKIGFMLRIKPEAIRIPKSGNGKYWVVNGTKEDLRPYSILSKRIKC